VSRLAISIVIASLGATPTSAHHAFAPVYDGSRNVTVVGEVTSFRFVNPHALMTLDVADDAGKVVAWTVEFSGRLNLVNAGWTESTIVVGERVTVSGNPARSGSPRLFFVELERPNGTKVLGRSPERFEALEQERQQRIQQRGQAPSQN